MQMIKIAEMKRVGDEISELDGRISRSRRIFAQCCIDVAKYV